MYMNQKSKPYRLPYHGRVSSVSSPSTLLIETRLFLSLVLYFSGLQALFQA